MVFSVTYYLNLRDAITIYWECKRLTSKVIYVLQRPNNLVTFRA